jgi:catechol 2,3-dioxygenase-like lactoylglutathione lyase family enzyme
MVAKSKLLRMDNVLLVVDDLEAAKAFFIELGMELEGETTVDGPLIGSLIGLKDVRATLAMMRTVTDGSSWTSSTRPIPLGLGLLTHR